MHCLPIQDLLEYDHLPHHDEVAKAGKFVIPKQGDPRDIVFVSSRTVIHDFFKVTIQTRINNCTTSFF